MSTASLDFFAGLQTEPDTKAEAHIRARAFFKNLRKEEPNTSLRLAGKHSRMLTARN